MHTLLEKIDAPEDLRKLPLGELPALCAEIRDYMVECCAVNPGHLGSSLGAVELIAALHYVYDTPEDKLVFDVGHQAYAHKILTGRREAFRGNRMREGISGFPVRAESPYDAFGAGHSSTSISAALGFAEAFRMQGNPSKVVAVIGDGALTGGLAWEGINNAGASRADLLIILNDNNISIDKNIGAVHESLLRITTDPAYNRLKGHVWDFLGDGMLRHKLQRWVAGAKSGLVSRSGGDLFEALGFRYFGPVDGNDVVQVVRILRRLRNLPGPRLLHLHTRKGQGYLPAEGDPTVWHAPGRFDPETGARQEVAKRPGPDRYQDVFGEVLLELARKDSRVVGVTPAMATGCGMDSFARQIPDRFFDVGIEEGHAVTFSAGLAAAGMRPVCNVYSSFSQRAYDNIIHDVALQRLPVIFCLDRAGVVGEDGPTHHGAFDLAAYRSIPGMVIAAPRNERELRNLMHAALAYSAGPMLIRYPRGAGEGVSWRDGQPELTEVGSGERLCAGKGVAVLAIGPVASRAVRAAEGYQARHGVMPAVYDMRFLKPLDTEILEEASHFDVLVTLEDGCLKGGLFGAVSEHFAAQQARRPAILAGGIPDAFLPQDTQRGQWAACHLDEEGIAGLLEKAFGLCQIGQ